MLQYLSAPPVSPGTLIEVELIAPHKRFYLLQLAVVSVHFLYFFLVLKEHLSFPSQITRPAFLLGLHFA